MIVHWCELCNKAPSDGILTVLPKGETKTRPMQACQKCVDSIADEEWLNNSL